MTDIEQVNLIIYHALDKIKFVAQELWHIIIVQAKNNSLLYLFGYILSYIIYHFIIKIFLPKLSMEIKKQCKDDHTFFLLMVLLILTVLALLLLLLPEQSINNFSHILIGVINPGYYLMHKIAFVYSLFTK